MTTIALYLAAIVLANLLTAALGPRATIANAFLLIGLDLTTRDQLHDTWHNHHLTRKMGALIAAGSILTVALNWHAWRIALASAVAFALSATTDTLVYHRLQHLPTFRKVTASNIAGALVDSLAFPALAFGAWMPWITLAQLTAKIAGGALSAYLLYRPTKGATPWPLP